MIRIILAVIILEAASVSLILHAMPDTPKPQPVVNYCASDRYVGDFEQCSFVYQNHEL